MPTAVPFSAGDVEFFENKIRPLFAAHCIECHGAAKQKGGLRLDSRAAIIAGGDSGSEVAPRKPDESRLITAVGYQDPDLQMPPKARLADEAIRNLRRWVEIGAPWGPEAAGQATLSAGQGALAAGGAKTEAFDLAARKARHWAWQPIRAGEIPKVRQEDWPQKPLDALVLSRLEAAGLRPAPAADRRALARRASFDLIGLPPMPAEVEAFVHDASPDAWPRLIDRLLASPHFGERWGRHWLDLARFAESRGHEFDFEIPSAYQYRDYVVRALNADVPYDQFVVEHVAGDLLEFPRRDEAGERNESVVATGFWSLGEWMHSPVDIRQDELDRIDNQVDVFGKTFLGMTVACARCHDHKFDAISTADYYSLVGFLHSSSYRDVAFEHQAHDRALARQLRAADDAAALDMAHRVAKAAGPAIARAADYLLAARDALLAARDAHGARPSGAGVSNVSDSSDRAAIAEKIAGERGLDAGLTRRWIDEIAGRARDDDAHPLHGWALATFGGQESADTRTSPATRTSAETLPAGEARSSPSYEASVRNWIAASLEPPPGSAAGPTDNESIVDYGALSAGQWIADGLAFGVAPRPAGAWRLGAGGDGSLLTALPQAAADTAGLGSALPGMLRTPTFVVSQPNVWYLARGSADVFLVVDSHRMISGPLHGKTRQSVNLPDWTWRRFDARAYQGQRAHLEFRTAKPTHEIAVAACAQSAAAPAAPRPGYPLLLTTLGAPGSLEPGELAGRYQRAIRAACDALSSGSIPPPGDRAAAGAAIDSTSLAVWIVDRRELFGWGPADGEQAQRAIAEHERRRAALVGQLKPSRTAMALLDGTPFDERVLLRGSPKTPGPLAPRRFLEALGGAEHAIAGGGSGRMDLARQLVDPANPLVSRVMVNRVWHHLMGRGIVASVDNFGVLGERPSNPELLDHLADRFVRDGWSIKRLIREIMRSSTYQLASRADDSLTAADPQNLLFGRANIRRLEGEAIRDAMLAISGSLNPTVGGPSVEVFVPAYVEGRGKPKSGPLDGANRRSLYIKVRRNFLPPMMLAFDMPIPFNTMGRRSVSNVPAQALILMNDPLVIELAGRWARRTLRTPDRSAADRVRDMYLAAFAREPLDEELSAALAFLDRDGELRGLAADKRLDSADGWTGLAHVLLNTKEFIYLN